MMAYPRTGWRGLDKNYKKLMQCSLTSSHTETQENRNDESKAPFQHCHDQNAKQFEEAQS